LGIPRVSAGTSWGCYCSSMSSAGTHRIQLPITRYSRPREHFLEKEYHWCTNRCSISGKLSFLSFSFFFRKCLIYVKRCRITHRPRSLVQGKPSQAHESRQLDRRDMKSVPGQVQLLHLYYIVQAVLLKSLFNPDSLSTSELPLKNNKRNFQSKSATRRWPRKQKELPRPACSSFSFHRSGNAQQSRSSVDENKAIHDVDVNILDETILAWMNFFYFVNL
jgi:hypothetical protein